MRHSSMYLDWYIRAPNVKHDFRSSGIANFKLKLDLGEIDVSANYAYGNPQAVKQLADWYRVKTENIFISTEGASGQNARAIRCIAEKNTGKTEAVVEYPTYEPLLRQVQEHFHLIKRLERPQREAYKLDAENLRKITSNKTGLLVITNPHAPSGAISDKNELKEMMEVAHQRDFYVLCDEIYAEFDRNTVPTLFSVDPEKSVVTTSFTKAYGLGGLKLGTALCGKQLVEELYNDVLNTVGNSPNIAQLAAVELLAHNKDKLESHRQKWVSLKHETEKWLEEHGLEYFPAPVGITYWVRLPVKDTYKWANDYATPRFSTALVPGAFFLFKDDYALQTTNMGRLGLGNIDSEKTKFKEALNSLERSLNGLIRGNVIDD